MRTKRSVGREGRQDLSSNPFLNLVRRYHARCMIRVNTVVKEQNPWRVRRCIASSHGRVRRFSHCCGRHCCRPPLSCLHHPDVRLHRPADLCYALEDVAAAHPVVQHWHTVEPIPLCPLCRSVEPSPFRDCGRGEAEEALVRGVLWAKPARSKASNFLQRPPKCLDLHSQTAATVNGCCTYGASDNAFFSTDCETATRNATRNAVPRQNKRGRWCL
eukprot:SAG11_NODE_2458_length_3338_cov_4.659463_4_plen_216_part_00